MLAEVPEKKRPATPLAELRTLKRSGFSEFGRVQNLLRQLTSTLDLEAAGSMLAGLERGALEATGLREQRIALLGGSTFNALPNLLTAMLVERGIVPKVRLGGFNQWRFEVLGGAPTLSDLKPRLVACLLDDQVIFERAQGAFDLGVIEGICSAFPHELSNWIDLCQATLGGTLVLSTLALSPMRSDRVIDYRNKARLSVAFARMNAEILSLSRTKARVVVLDTAALIERSGRAFAEDRLRHASGQVYAGEFLRAYAQELTRIAVADLGQAKKCLVLDLDNTLWSGVVGDDGVGGIRLGGGYPGSAHQELQSLARDLMAQGVMLTVCSKNDDRVAREAIDTHPEMVLKSDAFVAITANWEPKPNNLRAQAAALNIGTDAMVFVDDNPAERELMRQVLSEVQTVELPAEPASYASHLAARGDFNLLEITEEDRARTRMYVAQTQRVELERSADNLEDYLMSLESTLILSPLNPLNRGRVVQLFGKTNQFNMTGIRYSEDEITRRTADGDVSFACARLTDRFGDNGLIAALSIARIPGGAWAIENFVLSCRVFSRHVEHALVTLVLEAARKRGVAEVHAGFVETSKNSKFAGFYSELGFAESGGAQGLHFVRALDAMPELPRWIRISQEAGVFHGI